MNPTNLNVIETESEDVKTDATREQVRTDHLNEMFSQLDCAPGSFVI